MSSPAESLMAIDILISITFPATPYLAYDQARQQTSDNLTISYQIRYLDSFLSFLDSFGVSQRVVSIDAKIHTAKSI
jgi:hypothetical protein